MERLFYRLFNSQHLQFYPVANIDFPAGTAGGGTATHFSTGIALAGATAYWHSGPITPTIALGAGVQPRLTTATTHDSVSDWGADP